MFSHPCGAALRPQPARFTFLFPSQRAQVLGSKLWASMFLSVNQKSHSWSYTSLPLKRFLGGKGGEAPGQLQQVPSSMKSRGP